MLSQTLTKTLNHIGYRILSRFRLVFWLSKDKIVKEIIVYDDKIQIQFNSPLRTSPTDTTCSFFTEHKKIPCKYLNDFTFRTQDIEIILAI